MSNKNKIIAILGTTASGKTALAVDLACRFGGEVVSADSRQVYKYMDVGSGKDLDEYEVLISGTQDKIDKSRIKNQKSKIFKVPYHCIDLVDPKTEYNLAKYRRDADKAIESILGRGRLPIIAGGTGLYAQAIIDGYELSKVKPVPELRKKLEEKSAEELFNFLMKLDRQTAGKLSNSEKNNKRRMIRRIEIAENMGAGKISAKPFSTDFLLIGLTWPKDALRKRIKKRNDERLKNQDMIGEVENLHKLHKVSWKRLENFGLEYKYAAFYLQGKISYEKMTEELNTAVNQYARKQMIWLRRWERQGAKIQWVKNKTEARKLAKEFVGCIS